MFMFFEIAETWSQTFHKSTCQCLDILFSICAKLNLVSISPRSSFELWSRPTKILEVLSLEKNNYWCIFNTSKALCWGKMFLRFTSTFQTLKLYFCPSKPRSLHLFIQGFQKRNKNSFLEDFVKVSFHLLSGM